MPLTTYPVRCKKCRGIRNGKPVHPRDFECNCGSIEKEKKLKKLKASQQEIQWKK